MARSVPTILPSTHAPLEPILFPKLRIYFADFPYLHCSISLEALHLEDLLRLSVRPAAKATHSSRFSRSVAEAPDSRNRSRSAHQPSASPINLLPRTAQQSCRKEISPQPPRQRLQTRSRHRSHPTAGAVILNGFPFVPQQSRQFATELTSDLGSTHPWPSSVHMEPFPTSVFKAPI